LDASTSQSAAFEERSSQNKLTQPRQIALSGIRNFRDLGGYQTANGQMIRYGLLYRSANLHKLNDRDIQRIKQLSLRKVIDFRADFEVANEPDRLPADPAIEEVEIYILDRSVEEMPAIEQKIKSGKVDGIDSIQLYIETYTQYATQFTPDFQQFIHEILEMNGQPVLFHCAAGKDRTGFAAAILMRLLGVPMETIRFDYLLSNQLFLKRLRPNLWLLALKKGRKVARVLEEYIEAKPEYLAIAFETIERSYGSFDEYAHKGLNLTKEQIEHLRLLYLQ
jgi:protein-tyrosine phosphatase